MKINIEMQVEEKLKEEPCAFSQSSGKNMK